LSGTYESTLAAAKTCMERHPNRKILVVDSLSQAGGYGLLIALTLEKMESGASIDECFSFAEETKLRVCHYFVVDKLSYLADGGRISRATALIGSLIHLKPLLHTSRQGTLESIQKIMSRRKSIMRLAEKVRERHKPYSNLCYISHGDVEDEAKEVAKIIFDSTGLSAELMPLGAVIGCHSGPGTIAVFFTSDNREES
jgi:DegV family protein with EDD domain